MFERAVAERAPGRELLRQELALFVFKPGERGRLRLEAARGHDDLVIATALASTGGGSCDRSNFETIRRDRVAVIAGGEAASAGGAYCRPAPSPPPSQNRVYKLTDMIFGAP